MREIIMLLAVLGALQVHAKAKTTAKKLNLTPEGQTASRTQDPGSATRLLYEDPRNNNSLMAGAEKKQPKVKVQATCTDGMGMLHVQESPGYAGCLRTQDKTQPHLPGDNKRPAAVGITFGN